jgi:hypothetical protein
VIVAKQFFARWTRGGAPLVHLRVSFGWLVVRRGLDPVSRRSGQNTTSPGEWVAYADVHGVWRSPWPGVRFAADHSVIRLRRDVDFYVPRGGRWRVAIFTRECDLGAIGNAYAPGRGRVFPCPRTREVGALAGDDDPGVAIAWHGTGRGATGGYELNSRLEPSTCPRTVVRGCYAIAYRVERLPH